MSRHLLRHTLKNRLHRNLRRKYALRDEFLIDRAAGSVNGTAAEPGAGARVVTDGNSKLSITGGQISFATGGVAAGNPGLWYAQLARVPGLAFFAQFLTTTAGLEIGFDADQVNTITDGFRNSSTTAMTVRVNGTNLSVGTAALSTTYTIAVLARATGVIILIKGGAFTYFTIVSIGAAGTYNPYPAIVATTTAAVAVVEYMRAAYTRFLPVPIASDGFATTFATTDGLGHAEGVSGGVGAGGSGLTWTQQVGTWTVASAKANAATLTGSIAIATVPCGTADVMAECKVTRSAGQGGVVLRYTDANNYLYANHDGTNAFLKQVLAGVTTTLVTAAATYSANAVIRGDLSGVNGRLYYNGLFVGSTASINAALTATAHGLYVTDTTVTLDDLAIWPKGTANEHAALDSY